MKINYKTLKAVCLADILAFRNFGKVEDTPEGIYIYKDSGSKILGVAHLDTVLNSNTFKVINHKGDNIVINEQLDDRLGVYTLLFLLPQLGIEFDLLLTEGEETGRSTAQYFNPSKEYNFMFSFDRRGEDVVAYQYDDCEWMDTLEKSGFSPALGSFSDIAFLDHLGIKGVNIGTGYYGEHTNKSYASINTLTRQIKRFKDFYTKNKDTKFPHVEVPPVYNYRYSYNWEDWGEYDNLYCYLCNERQGKNQVTSEIFLCDQCFNECEMCVTCENIIYAHEAIDGICRECTEFERE